MSPMRCFAIDAVIPPLENLDYPGSSICRARESDLPARKRVQPRLSAVIRWHHASAPLLSSVETHWSTCEAFVRRNRLTTMHPDRRGARIDIAPTARRPSRRLVFALASASSRLSLRSTRPPAVGGLAALTMRSVERRSCACAMAGTRARPPVVAPLWKGSTIDYTMRPTRDRSAKGSARSQIVSSAVRDRDNFRNSRWIGSTDVSKTRKFVSKNGGAARI